MGPSGSGKTTLLNCLAGRRVTGGGSSHTGNVLYNGSAQSLPTIREITSYVEQEDALIGTLTAEETLTFAARLSMPRQVLSVKSLLIYVADQVIV